MYTAGELEVDGKSFPVAAKVAKVTKPEAAKVEVKPEPKPEAKPAPKSARKRIPVKTKKAA
jgi:hypothetical protein